MPDLTPNDTPDVTSDDQVWTFSWWLCMLPFFAAIGFFVWKWNMNKADGAQLFFAVLALIVGLVFTAMCTGAGKQIDDEKTGDAGTTSDTTKSS